MAATDKVTVEIARDEPVERGAVEIVERKGLGHPDSICDSVMDHVSVALCREYMKRTGRILHHNIDKGLLAAGEVEKRFGGGRVLKPMELIIGDRASFEYKKARIPADRIAASAARGWFGDNLPGVDPARHVRVRTALRPASAELSGIFSGDGGVLGANDTSAAVGYAPFTKVEKAVFAVERFVNSTPFKRRFPETGTDVKVMGIRNGGSLEMTVACPLMAGRIRSEKEYFRRKALVEAELNRFVRGFGFSRSAVAMNTLDERGKGMEGVYLSLLGTSAEDSDSGQVGRGNRVNGVISLMRPMGTEAAAGKNPVSHTGKIYSVLAHDAAREIHARLDGAAQEIYVWLVSRIGRPIDSPWMAYVKVVPARGWRGRVAALEATARAVLGGALKRVGALTGELAMGLHRVC